MARELLNCGGLAVSRTTYTSRREDNGTYVVERWLFHVPLTSPRQQILSKNCRRGAARESLAQRSTSCPAVLFS